MEGVPCFHTASCSRPINSQATSHMQVMKATVRGDWYNGHVAVKTHIPGREAYECAKVERKVHNELHAEPHVLPLRGYSKSSSRQKLVLAFPLCKGGSLTEAQERTPFNEGRLVRFSYEIASGASGASKRGWVHGDIKPCNVLLGTEEGPALLGDWGLASKTGTRYNRPRGSPHFMAPEVLMCARRTPGFFESDPRQDTYAIGMTLLDVGVQLHLHEVFYTDEVLSLIHI